MRQIIGVAQRGHKIQTQDQVRTVTSFKIENTIAVTTPINTVKSIYPINRKSLSFIKFPPLDLY